MLVVVGVARCRPLSAYGNLRCINPKATAQESLQLRLWVRLEPQRRNGNERNVQRCQPHRRTHAKLLVNDEERHASYRRAGSTGSNDLGALAHLRGCLANEQYDGHQRAPTPIVMVGTAGFEPATPCTQSRCATKLRHVPKTAQYERSQHFTTGSQPRRGEMWHRRWHAYVPSR